MLSELLSVCPDTGCPGAGSKKVLTTSRDNTLRVWDGGRSLAQLVSIPHNNFTGRWTIPFRSVNPTTVFFMDAKMYRRKKNVLLVFEARFAALVTSATSVVAGTGTVIRACERQVGGGKERDGGSVCRDTQAGSVCAGMRVSVPLCVREREGAKS